MIWHFTEETDSHYPLVAGSLDLDKIYNLEDFEDCEQIQSHNTVTVRNGAYMGLNKRPEKKGIFCRGVNLREGASHIWSGRANKRDGVECNRPNSRVAGVRFIGRITCITLSAG